MGLTPAGQGARAIAEGWTEKGGRLPVNTPGGLKAKGHPIGATGVSMHVLASMQLPGTAGDMQEIGRASCRESVCQYGEISVVACSLNKQIGNYLVTIA